MSGIDYWSTNTERRFIKNLGKHQYKSYRRSKLPKQKDLLIAYIKSAKKRSDWDGIDKREILKYARSLLKEIKNK